MNRYESLAASGVRYIYQGTTDNPNTFSNDIEPEYVEFNKDETKAYITLQVSGVPHTMLALPTLDKLCIAFDIFFFLSCLTSLPRLSKKLR